MAKVNTRYKRMETLMTAVLILDAVIFIAYLVFASLGWVHVKLIACLCIILVAAFGLWSLDNAKELLKPRSLWMTYGFCALVICTTVSLLCNFPR